MLIVGLTGGIGSGKSTVAGFFSQLKVPVIDADIIARQIAGTPAVLKQIQERFGTIDRTELRKIIFNDPVKKKSLEDLLHPLIIADIKKKLASLQTSYAIVVIPLLIETGPYSFIDRILVVDAGDEKCLVRSQLRDQASMEDIHKIIQSQASREKRLASADEIITNEGTIDDLRRLVEEIHLQYLKMA